MKGVSEKFLVLFITTMMSIPAVIFFPAAAANGNGDLITSYTWEGTGGYEASGVGTWGSSSGTITLSGIPTGATIEKAFIYWVCPSSYGLDTFIYLDGNGISGTQIGKDGILYGFRADVTNLVSGNGDYMVTDITTSYGASIVSVYNDPLSSKTMVIINDGMDTNYGQGLPHWLTGTTFSGFKAWENPQAKVTYIMGDGQKFNPNGSPYDKYSFNGNVIAVDEADGSDGNPKTHGWDTDTYDVSNYITKGDTTATANMYEENDELNWVSCVFSVTTGPAQIPPVADAGSDQTVYEGDNVLLDGSNSTGGQTTLDITNGMVSWWTGDGNTTDIIDGNHGILYKGATFDAGKVGKALSFDGVGSCMSVADSENLKITKSLSIDAWLYVKSYPPTNQGHGLVIFRGDSRSGLDPYYVSIQPQGTIRFHVQSTSAWKNLETPIGLNKWVFFAMTLDDTTGNMRIYLDGTLAKETTTSVRPFKDLHPSYNPGLGIGNHVPYTIHNMPYHGLIDEMEIFNRVLTPAEIKAIYDAGSSGKYNLSMKHPIISHEWDFEGDGIFDYQETTTSAPDGTFDGITTHVYLTPGTYDAVLRVTDESGATDTDSCQIEVLPINEPPVAVIESIQTINEGEVVQLNGSASYDPDGIISNYQWDFDAFDGLWWNTGAPQDEVGALADHVYGDNGIFVVTLRVTDNENATDTEVSNITVLNVNPTITIESAVMDVEIGLRVAGRKFNDVGMTLYENGSDLAYVSIERMPGSPDAQMAWVPVTLDMTKTYSAIVTYTPEDPPNIGGNPVWVYFRFPNGTIHKIHHTFNVQQSKKRDSDHWNHVEPWEVDLKENLTGWAYEVNYHIIDPGSDDENLTIHYGSQIVNTYYLNNPPNPDPYPSPEVNPRDILGTTTMIYEGPGDLILNVEDDDGGSDSEIVHLP